jgi:SAM-dependent methyltransferase
MSRDPVKRLLAGERVDDRDWDELYPAWIRALSHKHWTPVAVAQRAAEWLVTDTKTRVLDVGSGAGKFCAVGALTSGAVFTGVEQRPRLVQIARQVARSNCIKRCTFLEGNARDLDWNEYDALYLFNPFAEHLPGNPFIDDAIDRHPRRYNAYVTAVAGILASSREGTRLCTYFGVGADMPPGWRRLREEKLHGGPLSLWLKESDEAGGARR